MTGPGETRLKQNIKEAARMGEASFEDWSVGEDDYHADRFAMAEDLYGNDEERE